jgi:hypothetical protein
LLDFSQIRLMNLQPEQFKEKLLSKLALSNGCWVFTDSLDKDGYGRMRCGDKKVRTHRLSYEIFIGSIPEGMVIDHLCRNRSCANPDHLEAVTTKENILRGETGHILKNKTHCPQGHEYNKVNTRVKPTGHRSCKECDKISHGKRYMAKKAV